MSYNVNVTKDNQPQDYLAVLSLRRFLESDEFTKNADDFNYVSFDFGDVSAVEYVDTAFHVTMVKVESYDDLDLDSIYSQFF